MLGTHGYVLIGMRTTGFFQKRGERDLFYATARSLPTSDSPWQHGKRNQLFGEIRWMYTVPGTVSPRSDCPMWIVRVALNRPYTFIVLALLICILGTATILNTPADIFPNF